MYNLYIKIHNKTGLKYLGATQKNPYTYPGSGLYWSSHLKKYGNDVRTEFLGRFETIEELTTYGLHYSKIWKVVESDDWANLIPEAGEGLNVLKTKWNDPEAYIELSEADYCYNLFSKDSNFLIDTDK